MHTHIHTNTHAHTHTHTHTGTFVRNVTRRVVVLFVEVSFFDCVDRLDMLMPAPATHYC